MTFLLKRSEAISNFFLASWIIGDICNAVSVFLVPTLYTQRFLAVFFIFVDWIWATEHFYFLKTRKIYIPLPTNVKCIEIFIYFLIISILLGLVCAYGIYGHIQLAIDEQKYDYCVQLPEGNDIQIIIGTIFAYSASFFYIIAKPAQICKTKQRRTVEGVSFGNILSTCIGNLTQALSVIVENQDFQYLLKNLPFIASFLVPAFLDVISISQFYTYKDNIIHDRSVRKINVDIITTIENVDHQHQHDQSSELR
ncbi:Seven_transmembrane protein 1 [Hexamita inflata]|uniref:Seven transmembrane protein 1 n=1 Tax=Hexamita inflata TaxID=28002 RepID=A0AA86UP63_9EUKA|nr:Seven transmembrane protein 1 [Hexamita inflata]